MIGNGVEDRDTTRSTNGDARGPEDRRFEAGYGPPHPLDGVFRQVRELADYANLYVETRKDMVRATLRGLIWKAALGVVGAVAGVTVIIVAVIYLLSGIAHGLGDLFGERYWLGELVTGVVILASLVAIAFLGIRSLTKKARERTVKKYERRQQQQRERFGHSTTERAQQLRQTHGG